MTVSPTKILVNPTKSLFGCPNAHKTLESPTKFRVWYKNREYIKKTSQGYAPVNSVSLQIDQMSGACILVKGLKSDVWNKHCKRDLTAVAIYYSSKGGIERKVGVCWDYFPNEAWPIVISCDVNLYLTQWGSSGWCINYQWGWVPSNEKLRHLEFGWLLEEASMSDHCHVNFELTDFKPEIKFWRNARKTNWFGYDEYLTEKVKELMLPYSYAE